jgi:hypothetical protein
MSNLNLRTITNHFLDVRLVSLGSWRQANEIEPRDRGGPYVVLQEGYDPDDLRMTAKEFILGRSGIELALLMASNASFGLAAPLHDLRNHRG